MSFKLKQAPNKALKGFLHMQNFERLDITHCSIEDIAIAVNNLMDHVEKNELEFGSNEEDNDD